MIAAWLQSRSDLMVLEDLGDFVQIDLNPPPLPLTLARLELKFVGKQTFHNFLAPPPPHAFFYFVKKWLR